MNKNNLRVSLELNIITIWIIILGNVLLSNEIYSQPLRKIDSTFSNKNSFTFSSGIGFEYRNRDPNTFNISLSYDYHLSRNVLTYGSILYQFHSEREGVILYSQIFLLLTLEVNLFEFRIFEKKIKPYFDIGYGSGTWVLVLPNVGCGFEISLNDKIKLLSDYKFIELLSANHMLSLKLRYCF